MAIAETTRRAVADEQARIARELHDVIAHSVSVIVVQAAAADDVFDARPDQARAALRAIEARRARRAAASCGCCWPTCGRTPTPTRARSPGSTAWTSSPRRCGPPGWRSPCTARATPRALPAGVDLSAYRIVQEALTNTLRHAGASRADVTVRYAGDAVELDVRDDGARHDRARRRRRPRAHRHARARRDARRHAGGRARGARGGFRVHARLPLEARR